MRIHTAKPADKNAINPQSIHSLATKSHIMRSLGVFISPQSNDSDLRLDAVFRATRALHDAPMAQHSWAKGGFPFSKHISAPQKPSRTPQPQM